MRWRGARAGRATPVRVVLATVLAAPVVLGTVAAGTAGTAGAAAAVADPDAVVMVGAGDIATCRGTAPDQRPGAGPVQTAALLADNPDAAVVFTLGDTTYPVGAASEYTSCYDPTWGVAKALTRPTIGNHEYGTAAGAGYFDYFGAAAGDPSRGYYSYDVGPYWHVVVLNSECTRVGGCAAGSPQERWLRADLAGTTRNVVAMMHKPLFNTGEHGDFVGLRPLWRALHDYGADLVLSGHVHTYDRYAPVDPTGRRDAAYGIREIIVGTGGGSLTSVATPRSISETHDNTTWGVLRLTLHAGSYDWQFQPVEGGTYTDSGSTATHGRPPATVAFEPADYAVEEDAGVARLRVTRTGNTGVAAAVRYRVVGGTATQGSDFSLAAGSLYFGPGRTSRRIPVAVADDAVPERRETVRVSLASADPGTAVSWPGAETLVVRASDQQPDARISSARASGYVGKGIFDRTGEGQTKRITARRGRTRTVYVRVYNHGNVADTFAVRGSAAPRGTQVGYRSGGRDVTARVRSAAGLPVRLRPGAHRVFAVRLTVRRGAAVGTRKTVTMAARWHGDGLRLDRVRAVVRVRR